MSRTAIALLSTENLLHNVAELRQRAPNSRFIAMVKANAYGHGLRQTSARLGTSADILGVASIDEAIAIRAFGVKTPILLMEGVFSAEELSIASVEGFEVVFHGHHQIRWLETQPLANPIHAWLKIDTGMGRLGFGLHEARFARDALIATQKVQGIPHIMSHFGCADTPEHPLNIQQMDAFKSTVEGLSPYRSFCNSAALYAFPDMHYEYVRAGIALYGASPFKHLSAKDLGLKPVMTLGSTLIAIKQVKQGESLGYGARYICPRDTMVGVVAFGYGDGYPQSAPDGAPVLINGQRCKIIGRISMDMMTVDLSSLPSVSVGDTVTLWGEGLPIEEIAESTNQSVYTLLTGILNRVRFQWTHANESVIG